MNGDLRSTKPAMASAPASSSRRQDPQRGFRVEDRLPRADLVETMEDFSASAWTTATRFGSNWVAEPCSRRLRRRRRCRGRGGRPRRTRRAGSPAPPAESASPRVRPASPCRPSARTSCRARPGRPAAGRARQPSERASAGVLGDHASTSLVTAETANSNADPEPMQRRGTRAEHPQHPRPSRTACGCVGVLGRLERDVVAEPLDLLVGVGVAADVDQQRAVVGGRPRLVVQRQQLAQAQRDPALAQARAPSAGRTRDRSPATTPRAARPAGHRIGSVTHAAQPTQRAAATRKMRGSPHDPGAAAS